MQINESGLNGNQASNTFTFFIERRLPSLHNESVEDVDIAAEDNVIAEQVIENSEVPSNNRRTIANIPLLPTGFCPFFFFPYQARTYRLSYLTVRLR